MSTRLYLAANAETVPISPSVDAAWEDVSILARVLCGTSKRSLAMTTVSFADSDLTNKDILFRQYISPPLVAGQFLDFGGGTLVTAACRVLQDSSSNNMFLTIGIRIIAANGTTVQKTLVSVLRDDTAASAVSLINRGWGKVFPDIFNYTTVAGDRIVIEIGMGGDPNG